MASGRPDWNRVVTIQGSGNREVLVDSAGKLLSVMQGQDGEDLRTIYVDSSGKMVTRMQAATGGDFVVYVLDDCGDSDPVTDWDEIADALAAEENTVYVKEGSTSMKLGVDASINPADYAYWENLTVIGDMNGFNDDKVKLNVYINKIDYLAASGRAVSYLIGSSVSDYIHFDFTKGELNQGWNALEGDISNPSGTVGTVDWNNIDIQAIRIDAVAGNTDDFYIIVDSIVIVRDNPAPGTMKDVNTDANGFLLAKLVGSFGDHLKPIQADRYGNLRINLTEGGESATTTDPKYSSMLYEVGTAGGGVPGVLEFFDKSGPGVITAGYLHHEPNVSNKTSYYEFIIDGHTFTMPEFWVEDLWSVYTKDMDLIHLIRYDDTNFVYVHAFCAWIYWKTRIQIFVRVTTAPVVSRYRIVYSLF